MRWWRAGWPLLLWAVLMVAGGAFLTQVRFVADLSAFLPAQAQPQQQLLIDQLQHGPAARLVLVGLDGGTPAQRASASRKLAATLRASGAFEQVNNGAIDPRDPAWQAAGQWLLQHRYALSPRVTVERFTAPGLREAMGDTLALLGTPAGAAVKANLSRDPTGEVQAVAESLLPADAPRLEQGVWMARVAPRALLLLTTRADGGDLDGQAHAVALLQAQQAPLQAQGLTLRFSGAPVFSVQSRAQIEAEARKLATVGTVVMGALLLATFASLRALLLAFVPVATGALCGVVAVALVFGQVHGFTLAFGSTLIGEAVDYALYYLIQARRGAVAGQPGQGWRAWLAQGWPTVRLGLLTSLCGFAALLASGFPGLAQLGVFSMAGLLAAAAATRWLLPRCMPDGAAPSRARAALGRGLGWAAQRLPALRWPLVALGVVAAMWLALRPEPLWRGDLLALSPVPREALALDAALRADLHTADAGLLVVARGADEQAALRAAEAAGERLDALVGEGVLAGYDSPARLLPSTETQARRAAALPLRRPLAHALSQATAGGPLPAARLKPFVDDVQAARSARPVTHADLDGLPLAPMLDALLFQGQPHGGQRPWFALMALHPVGEAPVAPQVHQALAGLSGTWVIEVKPELDALYGDYLDRARWQAGLGVLAVLALLAITLRSARQLARVVAPLVLAVVFTLAALAAAQVPLGILHLVGLLLVAAVGSNYALFFVGPAGAASLDDDMLASLALANLTTVVSFGLIAASPIASLQAMGQVVAPGALLALVMAAVLAPRAPR